MALNRNFVWLALACTGCTELASGTDTLAVGINSQQVEGDAAPEEEDPLWGCLGETLPPRAVSVRTEAVLTLSLIDTSTGVAPPGVSVRACNRLDVGCTAPLRTGITARADGLVPVSLPLGFDGFLEITTPQTVPTLFFVNEPLLSDTLTEISVVAPVALQLLATSGGVSLNPQSGHLLVRAFDCQGEFAAGVELSNDKGGQPFTFVGGLPSLGGDVTTADGFGGFVNVPPGLVVLQGREVQSGIISGTTSVVVRPEWVTYGDVEPLPPP